MNRREFLKLTSTGLLVAFSADAFDGGNEAAAQGGRQTYPTDFNAYLHIGADNKVTCLVGKVELGQGIVASLAQLLAEDLGVDFAAVTIVCGDTDLCPWDGGTFGSLSIRAFGPVLRAAAAEARGVLLAMAAETLQAPVESLSVKSGVVTSGAGGAKKVTYGQLTGGKRIERTLAAKPELKPVKAFTIVGTSAPRRDAIEKVTGRAKYAGDIVPTGALYARILRPPAHGAVMTGLDISAAEKVPGVDRRPRRRSRRGAPRALGRSRQGARARESLLHAQRPARRQRDDFRSPCEERAGRAARRGGRRSGDVRRPAAPGVRPHLLRHVPGARADGNAFGGGGDRERQGHRLGRHADALPAEEPDHAGPEAAGRAGARHHAVRRGRLRREVGVEPGRRGRTPGQAGRQARPRRVQPRRGVLLRHVPARGGDEDPVGPRRVGQDCHVGVQGLRGRRPRRRALLRHPASPDACPRRLERRRDARVPSVRGRPVARSRAPAPTRSPASLTSTSWRRKRASIPSSSG